VYNPIVRIIIIIHLVVYQQSLDVCLLDFPVSNICDIPVLNLNRVLMFIATPEAGVVDELPDHVVETVIVSTHN